MPAPKGHPMYGNPRNPKVYEPDEFWDKFMQYLDWCDENPIIQQVPHVKTGVIDVKHKRPYSIEAFCTFANITTQTFYNYAKAEGYEMYFDICTHIKQIIDTQHLEGGFVGTFNAGLVARKLGLAEKVEQQNETTINWKEEKVYETKPKTDKSA